jgi:lysophospholipase L1-like esterase
MRNIGFILLAFLLLSYQKNEGGKLTDPSVYLSDIKTELIKEWPNNRTINLVFHGHSVPAGYFKTPVVNSFDSYPFQVLETLKEQYPFAVINVINTAIGGENSVSGEKRFESTVLIHQPDVLLIDYALNDRSIGLDQAANAWSKMIQKALKNKIKVILLTPSPDQRVDILEPNNELEKHAFQIRSLSKKYDVGLVDSYEEFRKKAISGEPVSNYMSQVNHPNAKGHLLIANKIAEFFQ